MSLGLRATMIGTRVAKLSAEAARHPLVPVATNTVGCNFLTVLRACFTRKRSITGSRRSP